MILLNLYQMKYHYVVVVTHQTEQTAQQKQTQRNYVELTETSKVADRFKLSNMAVAAVATAVLVDLDVVNSENTQLVIDKNKVDRARRITHKTAIENQEKNRTPLIALYFDGRGDLTKVRQGKKIVTKREEVEQPGSLVEQPGSLYLGHVTNVKKSAIPICADIWNFIVKHLIPTEDLVIAGADGAPTNTGWKGRRNSPPRKETWSSLTMADLSIALYRITTQTFNSKT